MGHLYDKTMKRISTLQENGYSVTTMWECEFDKLVKNDKNFKGVIGSLSIPTPLDPREALSGGRTNALKLYHKALDGESIRYYDIKVILNYVYF